MLSWTEQVNGEWTIAYWLNDWLIDWLIGWLIDWLLNLSGHQTAAHAFIQDLQLDIIFK